MNKKVTIIDYGLGNLLSVQRGFEHLGISALISSDPKIIMQSERVVLPGVGAFPKAMALLEERGLTSVVKNFAASGKPLLAICLGMQLLLEHSEEFVKTRGLNLIPGNVRKIPQINSKGIVTKVPHIGWNSLEPSPKKRSWNGTILEGTKKGEAVYFVHSYLVSLEDDENELAYTLYENHKISSVISKDRIYGCQFHPEKSGAVGLNIMRRFCLD